MMQFFRDVAHNPFLATGLLAGLLASLACGVVGPYVVTKRIVFLSGAIAHMAVAGVGATIWLNDKIPAMDWFQPVHGAMVAALAGAILIAFVHEHVAERMDTLIGALWAVGMAVGILFIKLTPGYHTELMSYLFGNISVVKSSDVVLLAVLNLIILAIALAYHKRFLAICLDQQQAEIQGINVFATNAVLLCLVALTVICLTQIVGLILVMALLTLPAAAAAHHVDRISGTMIVATGLSLAITTLPRLAVYGTSISPESAIVLAAGAVYLGSTLWHVRRSE
ncbi:MAG: metal ABC transporter permease [Planctomycetota bacterium]